MSGDTSGEERRRIWEENWAAGQVTTPVWWTDELPTDLHRSLELLEVPANIALDVGCGDGVMTVQLSNYFAKTVGIDFAESAIRRAVGRAENQQAVRYLTGDAAQLPFRDGSFALVFDRGCLQMLPRERFNTYFSEVARVLQPGGALQLFISKEAKDPRVLLSRRGHRALLRWLRGRAFGPQFVTRHLLETLAEGRMEVAVMESAPYRPPGGGNVRTMFHAIYLKS